MCAILGSQVATFCVGQTLIFLELDFDCSHSKLIVGAHFFAGRRKYGNMDPNSVFYPARLGVI